MRTWLLLAFACAMLQAQTPPAGGGRTIRVPVIVNSEEPVRASDFKVTLTDGSAARVTRVRTPKDDLMLLAVLDMVGDVSLVEPAREALSAIIGQLPPSTWVALLRAQDGLHVLADPTLDREKIQAGIGAVRIGGKAGLLDTLETAADLADSIAAKSGVRIAVLYVTDSDVRNYREDFTNPVINSSDYRDLSRRFPEGLIREKISKLANTLGKHQAPLFIAHLQYRTERLNEAYQTGLLQLATVTGGIAEFSRSQAEIPETIARVVRRIQSHYMLLVQLPQKASKSLALTVQAGDAPATYRTHYQLK